jgi:hypothetical protein
MVALLDCPHLCKVSPMTYDLYADIIRRLVWATNPLSMTACRTHCSCYRLPVALHRPSRFEDTNFDHPYHPWMESLATSASPAFWLMVAKADKTSMFMIYKYHYHHISGWISHTWIGILSPRRQLRSYAAPVLNHLGLPLVAKCPSSEPTVILFSRSCSGGYKWVMHENAIGVF